MKTELEKLRTRWYRFLGQKCRVDRDTWVELLNCNWADWANKINDRTKQAAHFHINIHSDRSAVYHYFQNVIAEATRYPIRAVL